jgi:hypothetical protein
MYMTVLCLLGLGDQPKTFHLHQVPELLFTW